MGVRIPPPVPTEIKKASNKILRLFLFSKLSDLLFKYFFQKTINICNGRFKPRIKKTKRMWRIFKFMHFGINSIGIRYGDILFVISIYQWRIIILSVPSKVVLTNGKSDDLVLKSISGPSSK
jgi:hypothetical protein